MPVTTVCPLCREDRLSIYQDTTSGGEWHYCFSCKSCGDMVELAAAKWGTTPYQAVNRLAMEGVSVLRDNVSDQEVTTRLEWQANFRSKLQEFWKRAQLKLVKDTSSSIATIRKRLVLPDNMSRERMMSGPARLFGACSTHEAFKLFGLARQRALFRGRGWKDTLVVPYFGAPGMINALFFVGRYGDNDDRVLKLIPGCNEIGLAGLEGMIEDPTSYAIAVTDPVLLLRMQMRNFNTSLRPLPMVAWQPGKRGTFRSWSALNGRQLILWDMDLKAETIQQCYNTEAHLVVEGPQLTTDQHVGHYLRKNQPLDLVARLCRKAKPWREALRKWLKTAPEKKAIDLLAQLGTIDIALGEEAKACVPKSSALRGHSQLQIRRAKVGNVWVVERGGKWYVEKNGNEKMLLNGILRITKLVLHEEHLTEYRGTLVIGDKRLPVEFNENWLRNKGLLGLLKKIAWDEAGMRLQSSYTNQLSLPEVAEAFHRPEVVDGVDRIGWDGRGFQFKSFRVEGGSYRSTDPDLLQSDCPGPAGKPGRLTETTIKRLSRVGPEVEWMWAVFSAVAQAALGALRREVVPHVLTDVRGCLDASTALLRRIYVDSNGLSWGTRDRGVAHKLNWPHQWPVCVKLGKNSSMTKLHRWLLETPIQGVICQVRSPASCVIPTAGDFILIRQPEAQLGRIAQIPVEKALPNFLKFITNSPELPEKETLWETTHTGLIRWARARGIRTAAIEAAKNHVRLHGDPRTMVEAIRAIERPRIKPTKRTRVFRGDKVVELRDYYSHKKLRKHFRDRGWIEPDLEGLPDPIMLIR